MTVRTEFCRGRVVGVEFRAGGDGASPVGVVDEALVVTEMSVVLESCVAELGGVRDTEGEIVAGTLLGGVRVDVSATVVVFSVALHAADIFSTAWMSHLHSLMDAQGHSSPGLSTSQSGFLAPGTHPCP